MSGKWERVPLGELLTRSENWINIDPESTYRQITVRWWGQGAVQRDVVSGAEIAEFKRQVVRPQQFIISRIDARKGASGLVPDSLDGAVVSTDFPVFNIDQDRLAPQWLAWLSRTPGFVDLCEAASEGTTNRVRLKEDKFLATRIPLPPLFEQQRIVAWIEALAAKIDAACKLRSDATEQAAKLISSLHLQLADRREVALGDILVLHEIREEIHPDRTYPQVGVRAYGQGLFAKDAVAGSHTTYKVFNKLYDGALVLSQVKGWEGAIGVCEPSLAGYYVSPEYRTFRCIEEEASPGYLAAVVATPWFWLQLGTLTRGVGGRRERTRPEALLALHVPMPGLAQQQRAIPVFEWLRKVKPIQDRTTAELNALLPSVLDKAFKGEL